MERLLTRGLLAAVRERDLQTLREEGHFPKTLLQGVVIKHDLIEDRCVREKCDSRAGAVGIADARQLRNSLAALVALTVLVPVALHDDFKPVGESVDDGSAHAMKTAGDLVSSTAEFAARVKDRENDFHGADALFLIDLDRNPSTVVANRHGAVFVDEDVDLRADAGQRLVHGIVHDLIHEMVQTSRGRRTDVHTGTLAHRFQTLQDLDLFCAVFLILILIHTEKTSVIQQ